MAAGQREHIAKQLLQAHVSESDGRILIQRKPPGVKPTTHNQNGGRPVKRGQRNPQRPPSPSSTELEQREQGWNDRFFRDTPSQPKRPQRASRAKGEDTSNASTQDQKERKIREERQQYGHGEITGGASHKQQRPGVGRLVPIGALPVPPREPDTTSSKDEKLRFNVLKAIDVRETLIYQLNALVLCTPVQEALVMAASRVTTNDGSAAPQLKPRATMALAPTGSTTMTSGGVHAMSNAREATRLAQQLASDLQVTGIQVVEGMVEWMLQAGAKADKPPEFLWRGRNYFRKMETDLDFAGPELRARGVELDCFSKGNPLCIRPDQRLGRVLAAQSIIHEMVTMATQQQQQQQQDATPRSGRKASGRKEKKSPRSKSHRTPRRQKDTSPYASNSAAVSSETAAALLALQGADEMILATSGPGDDDDDYGDEDNGFSAARSARAGKSDHESVPQRSNQDDATGFEDPEAEKELVNLLDESLGDTIAAPAQAAPATTATPSGLSESAKSSARDEYENSFDDDEAEDTSTLKAENDLKGGVMPPEPRGDDEGPDDEEHGDEAQAQPSEEASEAADDNQIEDDKPEPEPTVVSSPSQEDEDARRWQRVAEVLRELRGDSVEEVSGEELQQKAAWVERRRHQLDAALDQSVHTWGKDAFDGSLTQLLLPLRTQIVDLCEDPVSTSLRLCQRVLEECLLVMDGECEALSASVHQEIESSNPLVSEVDFADVLDVARKQFRDKETSVSLRSVSRAMGITMMLRESASEVSRGFSRLIQVFYPYLINQRRDRLVHSWQQVSQLLKQHLATDVEHAAFLLDATCKVLLLNVAALQRNSSDDEDGAVPKLTLVCDRATVLESSVAAAHKKCLSGSSTTTSLPSFQLYPFFESSFGEKRVDGVQVEEGEGKGPLKEWFTLVASDLTAKWRAVPLPVASSASNSIDDFDPVLVNGNKLVVDRLDAVLKAGYKVEWHSPSDQTNVSRIVNSCDVSNGAYLLDRGGLSNQSFAVTELRVFQPKTAVLEYIQASESYWLNESLADTPPNRQTLLFLGWFLANALVHQCSLQLRLHRLLCELLLDSSRVVTLQDLESLDPSLWTAMQQMKHMKPAEFASYLEFEGVADASSLSVDDYIARTVDEKYGAKSSLAWQLQELRSGFTRVYTPSDLRVASITASDLVDQLCADGGHNADQDLDLERVFRVSLDPDFASCAPLRRSFWTAVNGFDPRLKRLLVKFVTGVETLPQPNTEFLRIEMPFPAVSPNDLSKTLRMLPQSHTCDNALELPHYWRALCWKAGHDAGVPNSAIESELVELLGEKLRLAAEYSAGYGLDGTAATTASLSSMLPGSHSSQDQQLAAQESYDSLDLPALGEGSMASARGSSRPGSRTPVTMGQHEEEPPEEEPNQNPNQSEQLRDHDDEATSASAAVAVEKDEEAYDAEDWEEEELAE